VDHGRQTWRDWIEQPERWALALCALVVVVLLTTEAGSMLKTLRAPAPSVHMAGTATAAADYVGRVNAANLFGRAPAVAGSDQSLPQTQLQLTLRGVFTADDPALASAIIETGDGKMQIVKTGGGLGTDATLQTVYANRVVVARNGVLENLYFPTASNSGEIATVAAPVEAAPVAAAPVGSEEDERKANILHRLEELRARGALSQ